MRVFLVVCLSQALLCAVILGDDVNEEEHHDDNVDDNTLQNIVPGTTNFANSLYNHLSEKYPKDNLWFSPMSISLVFSMLSVGTKGQTQTQMYNALGFNMSSISQEDINRGFKQLLQVLNQPDTDLELSNANAIFVDLQAKLIEKFSDDLKNFYESEVILWIFKMETEQKLRLTATWRRKPMGRSKTCYRI